MAKKAKPKVVVTESPVKVFMGAFWQKLHGLIGQKWYRRVGAIFAPFLLLGSVFTCQPECLGEWAYDLRHSVPVVDQDKFAVGVAELGGDAGNLLQKELIAGISDLKKIGGIEVVRIPRRIEPNEPIESERISAGNKRAKQLLSESGASIALWGEARGVGAARIFWVISDTLEFRRSSYRLPLEFQLPEMLETDLSDALIALIAVQFSALDDRGKYNVHGLREYTSRVKSLLSRSTKYTGDSLHDILILLAGALSTIGEQSGDLDVLEEAAETYRKILAAPSQPNGLLERAIMMNNLGTVLVDIGSRDPGTELLDEAVRLYDSSLTLIQRSDSPWHWAMLHANLCLAYMRIGERERGTKSLEKAVIEGEEALKVYTRSNNPNEWAGVQSNIGSALLAMLERSPDTVVAKKAKNAYESALEVYTHEKAPVIWAGMQNNLGNALRRLGEYKGDTKLLLSAKKAFESSLTVFEKMKFPQDWSRAQSNLASVYQSLEAITGNSHYLVDAVGHFLKALEVRDETKSPFQWGLTQNHLGNTYVRLWKSTKEDRYINSALLCHVRAWRVLRDDWGHYRDITGNAIWSDLSFIDDNGITLDLVLYTKDDSAALWHFRPQIRNNR